jgi:hypothetical protein
MYIVRNGDDLQRGDLIAVCGCNQMELGIYYGRGKSGTIYGGWSWNVRDNS